MVNRRSRNLSYTSIPAMVLAFIAPFAADAQSPHITLALHPKGTSTQIRRVRR